MLSTSFFPQVGIVQFRQGIAFLDRVQRIRSAGVVDEGAVRGLGDGVVPDEADDGSDQILLGLLSRVLLVGFGDLHPKEDTVDGADRDDYGNRRPEYGVEYLQYRLDHRMEIDVGQNNRVQFFPPSVFFMCLISSCGFPVANSVGEGTDADCTSPLSCYAKWTP